MLGTSILISEKLIRKELKDQLWNCAKATCLLAYEKAMNMLNGMSLGACEYMGKIDHHHWSRAYFQIKYKCGILLNNLCECFNSHIPKARIKGIVTMNEIIITKLMMKICQEGMLWKKYVTIHCPRIHNASNWASFTIPLELGETSIWFLGVITNSLLTKIFM